MKPFQRDILVCDFEVTGFDIDVDEPVQIGLILLDKETLEPKWSYSSWIKPSQPVSLDREGFRWASLDQKDLEEIQKAPDLTTVANEIIKSLPKSYYLCAWNAIFDFCFWNKLLKTVGMKAKTATVLDLWTLAQSRLLNDGKYTGDYKSESVFQYFGAKPRTKHYGISDCEIEAMILRKLMQIP
ncbi:MAG: 3'-5' exonuclease [bacterium]|nr:3'-5' exonuclease [bacterium]